ncbi:MAG: DUF349 domain-containing protein [Cyclobacteriaceae bacterium]|nr:DUF349 domain-containing protein [Cyclobacteriaceae bacterium]
MAIEDKDKQRLDSDLEKTESSASENEDSQNTAEENSSDTEKNVSTESETHETEKTDSDADQELQAIEADAPEPAPEEAVENTEALSEESTQITEENEIQADTQPTGSQPVADNAEESKEAGTEDKETQEPEEHEEETVELDYTSYSKKQLVQVLEALLKEEDYSKLGRILKEVKPVYDEMLQTEKDAALRKFVEGGGEADGFEFTFDELDHRFTAAYNELRERRSKFYNSLEEQKERNLAAKMAILEKLRGIVDSDETQASVKEIKDIQEEWKNVGPVPPQQVKNLWANYNALIDRYYDKRSIYFELKELDRKKNLEIKNEIVDKAERLSQLDNIKDAIKDLNDLHEEFKHVGPVPADEQEALWQRFKTASDAVYARRKEFYDSLKDELNKNLEAKQVLADKVQEFSDFNSDKITDWNAKTKAILELQKQWEAIGGLPREAAREVNKKFWNAFKSFFNHKGQFFKKIEESRLDNLKQKEALVEKAEAVKDSEDFAGTAEELKNLQRQWKEIGPVPERFRNQVYDKFKAACDHFFNRKRESTGQSEKEYEQNLKKKKAICEEIQKLIDSDSIKFEDLEQYIEDWSSIGFVPKNSMKSIQNKLVEVIEAAIEKAGFSEEEENKLRFSAKFSKIKFGPNADRMIQKKENSLRRQIAKLENDISLWKNNMSFFAESKTADKLKADVSKKIERASKELEELEEQLRAITNF